MSHGPPAYPSIRAVRSVVAAGSLRRPHRNPRQLLSLGQPANSLCLARTPDSRQGLWWQPDILKGCTGCLVRSWLVQGLWKRVGHSPWALAGSCITMSRSIGTLVSRSNRASCGVIAHPQMQTSPASTGAAAGSPARPLFSHPPAGPRWVAGVCWRRHECALCMLHRMRH